MIPAAHAQSETPDLPTYTNWVREAFIAAQRNDRLGLEETAVRLITTTSVRLPDNTTIAVDNSWLQIALQPSAPDLSMIAERLGAIIDALAQPASSAPADARERLQQLLSQPPFKAPEPVQTPTWLDEFLNWLARVLSGLLRPIGSVTPSGGNTIVWLVVALFILLIAAVLFYVVRGLLRGMPATSAVQDDDPEAHLTAKTALDQASDLAYGGDYRTAVRYLYISALLWLDERNILRYDRALTNREYLERVRDNPDLRAHMALIVDTFDRVWYGHLPIDAEAFAVYRQQVEALRHEV